MSAVLEQLHRQNMRTDLPDFVAGDTIVVNVRVREGNKDRIQAYKGVVIQRRGKGISETVTVRKISNGVGVERIFPIHAPMISSIELDRKGSVRRARIFYLRNLRGKAARIKEDLAAEAKASGRLLTESESAPQPRSAFPLRAELLTPRRGTL